MKKHYHIQITAYACVFVMNAESEEDAADKALEVDFGIFQVEDTKVCAVIDPDDTAEIDAHKRHLDAVVSCEPEEEKP